MRKGLLRVLDVRRLLEELASVDLQTRAAELRRLEKRAEEHRMLAAEARDEAMRRLLDEAVTDSWLGMADAEIFSWKRERMQEAAQHVSEKVAASRENMKARQIEREQAEALVTKAARVEEQERIRREQQHVDDWFQSLPSPGPRHSE